MTSGLFAEGVRLGFTGTQAGMSAHQMKALAQLIDILKPTEFHHGDCVGADAEAHDLVRRVSPSTRIVLHPPTNGSKRAHKSADIALPAQDYLARNRAIVVATDMLAAAPRTAEEELRSGTWATVRYARKWGGRFFLLLPAELSHAGGPPET